MEIIGGVVTLYETFTIAATVPMWFGDVPLKDGSAAAVNPPYVRLIDKGTTVKFDAEYHAYEKSAFDLEIYATSLADAETIASAIRYNGGSVTGRAGLDFTESIAGFEELDVRRVSQRVGVLKKTDLNAKHVFRLTLSYEVTALRTA